MYQSQLQWDIVSGRWDVVGILVRTSSCLWLLGGKGFGLDDGVAFLLDSNSSCNPPSTLAGWLHGVCCANGFISRVPAGGLFLKLNLTHPQGFVRRVLACFHLTAS